MSDQSTADTGSEAALRGILINQGVVEHPWQPGRGCLAGAAGAHLRPSSRIRALVRGPGSAPTAWSPTATSATTPIRSPTTRSTTPMSASSATSLPAFASIRPTTRCGGRRSTTSPIAACRIAWARTTPRSSPGARAPRRHRPRRLDRAQRHPASGRHGRHRRGHRCGRRRHQAGPRLFHRRRLAGTGDQPPCRRGGRGGPDADRLVGLAARAADGGPRRFRKLDAAAFALKYDPGA